jgi:hypothetical protein
MDTLQIAPRSSEDWQELRRGVNLVMTRHPTPETLRAAIAAYIEKWPEMECTPRALAKHWYSLLGGKDGFQQRADATRQALRTHAAEANAAAAAAADRANELHSAALRLLADEMGAPDKTS